MTRTLIFRLRHVPQPLDGRPRKGIARDGVGVALEGCRLTTWTLVERGEVESFGDGPGIA